MGIGRRTAVVWLAALLCLGLVSGCAWFGPRPAPLTEAGFALQGKLGVRQGREGFSANFIWRQYQHGFDIELWGPLGQGRTRLQSQGDGLLITSAQGEQFHEPDTAQAMAYWLGVSIPLAVLQHWIQGQPAPAHPLTGAVWDSQGNLQQLEQLDWQLEFSDYRLPDQATATSNLRQLPGRVRALQADTQVTIVSRHWGLSGDLE